MLCGRNARRLIRQLKWRLVGLSPVPESIVESQDPRAYSEPGVASEIFVDLSYLNNTVTFVKLGGLNFPK